jgi:hypothetical protein
VEHAVDPEAHAQAGLGVLQIELRAGQVDNHGRLVTVGVKRIAVERLERFLELRLQRDHRG